MAATARPPTVGGRPLNEVLDTSVMDSADQEFRRQVGLCLGALNSDIEPLLRRLIQHDYPLEVAAIDFEVFSDGFTSEFPIRCYFLDSNNCEFFVYEDGKATYPSPVDPGLLLLDGVYPSELESELEARSPDSDPWSIAADVFFGWFLSRWRAAGGAAFKRFATLAHHDSGSEVNLMTGARQPRGNSFR
jgi:hypothetical protein